MPRSGRVILGFEIGRIAKGNGDGRRRGGGYRCCPPARTDPMLYVSCYVTALVSSRLFIQGSSSPSYISHHPFSSAPPPFFSPSFPSFPFPSFIMSGGNGEAVKVIVRCRPMNTKEKNLNCQKIIKVDQNTLQVHLLKPEVGMTD